jgi:hypothetical protein
VWYKMTRTELIIQVLKVAIGLAFGAYFVWWSLQVLDRLTPEYDVPTAVAGRAPEGYHRAGGHVVGMDARLRSSRGSVADVYTATREAAMAAFAKSWRRE